MANPPVTDRIRVERPAHVPAELVVDIDFYNLPGASDDVHLAWKRMHDGPDIVWSPHNGGHWIFTRAEDIKVAQVDHEHFSMKSITVPYSDTGMKPINLDPPHHTPYRRLIMPNFMPKPVDRLEPIIRQYAINLIEGLKDRGECDFAADFCKALPVKVFLGMVDLPEEDRAVIQPYADDAVRGTQEQRASAHRNMAMYIGGWLEKRRLAPGEDMLSQIVTADINGEPISREDAMSMAMLLLFGGLDTVASLLGFVARFLAMNPSHRQQILDSVDDPVFLRHAVEELIRRHGVANTARLVTKDFEYKHVQLREGDIVQAPNCLFGLDERVVERPLEVDFTRKFAIQHAAFGNGPHTCPGAVLARREVQVFLEEWLPRIPHFELAGPATMSSGSVNGIDLLPLRW